MVSWRWAGSAAALGIGLLVGGCSGPPAPSPPTRAVVAWSDTVCATVKSVEEVRTAAGPMRESAQTTDPYTAGNAAEMYLGKAGSDLPAVRRTLSMLTPAGLHHADDYVAGLLGALNPLWPELPQPDHVSDLSIADKLTRAQRVARMVDVLQPRLQDLATIARADPDLVNSFDLAPDCAPPTEPVPRRELVSWADTMCTAVRYARDLPTIPFGDLLDQPAYAEFRDLELAQYIAGLPGVVQQLHDRTASLAPTGDQAADGYRAALLGDLAAVAPKLPEQAADPSDADPHSQAMQVSAAVTGLTPPGPSLADLAGRDPDLAVAYGLAPGCDQPGASARPALSPRDGTDLAACRAGSCQVEVDGRAQLQVNAKAIEVVISAGWADILNTGGMVWARSGTDSDLTESDGTTVHVAVVAMTGDTAVLDVSTTED